MGQDRLGAYEEAVDGLVNLIEVFPDDEPRYDIGDAEAGNLLLSVADEYAARANEVFDSLIERIADEADIDRILALAAGDFRLAASLVAVDDYWSDGDAVDDDGSAQQEEERSALRLELAADLPRDMDEIKAAVRGEPEDSDGGGSSREPRPRPDLPNPSAPHVTIPPLNESFLTSRIDLREVAVAPQLGREPTEESAFVVRGGAPDPDPLGLVQSDIDNILNKAAAQISDLALAGIPVVGSAFSEFNDFLVGQLGKWYGELLADLGGLIHRAKRCALKLLYEGLEKLLCLLRRAVPLDVSPGVTMRTTLIELAKWLEHFALTRRVRQGLDVFLSIDSLKSHVRTKFEGLEDKGAQRAIAVSVIEDNYRKNKFPVTYGRVAVRAFRLARAQHFAPPHSEIAMGCAILGLCGISGWIAQDSLDHPPVRFAPNLRRGVRAAVDGNA